MTQSPEHGVVAITGTSIATFERDYPELYWHVAKGKICAGEPLYGAIITTLGGTEISHGESDVSADEAFTIAVRNVGLAIKDGVVATPAEPETMVERIAIDMHYADGDPCTVKWAKQPGKYRASLRKDVRDVLASMERLGIFRPDPAPSVRSRGSE